MRGRGGFSALFIRRPVGTLLLALGLLIAGMVAFRQLPVAALPAVDFPTILVQAKLAGADPATMAATVAAPLERRLGEIPGVAELTSTSSQGAVQVVIQFDVARDITGAAHDVQAAINASLGDMPADLPARPTYRKMNPADAPILVLAVTSDTLPPAMVFDAADAILSQRISQVEGVARVQVGGAEKPAVRVEVDPSRLAAMGMGMEAVRTALAAANADLPKGGLDGPAQAWSIAVNDQLATAEAYRPLIARVGENGGITRLADVATLVDGTETARMAGWYDTRRAVLVIVTKQAGANVIDTVARVKALLPQLERWMPAGTRVSVMLDRTANIEANLEDVETTLGITILLVVAVVYLSLGHLTPTLAASITVPLALAATFAAMWLAGYSLDSISLMAVIISVGFVVDDAIVMIENVARHIERGGDPLEAAIAGAREITFTVVSITLSLIAVFIPLLFMGGLMGRLFQEFAVTLTVAIAMSAVVSLTVAPTLYGHLMAWRRHRPPSRLARWGEAAMGRAQAAYLGALVQVLRHRRLTLAGMVATVVLTVALYALVPKGLLPSQDTGLVTGITEARTDIPFHALVALQQAVIRAVLEDPAVASVASFLGSAGPGAGVANQGHMFIGLKPLARRAGASAEDVVNRLRPRLARIEGVATYLSASQDIRAGGRESKGTVQFVLRADQLDALRIWTPRLIARLRTLPELADVSSDQEDTAPQATVVVDRDSAARLGVSMLAVDQVLDDAFAERQVSTLYTQRDEYHVVLEVDPRFQTGPSMLHALYVTATDGTQVPLDALARFVPDTAPISVTHQGQEPSAMLSFNLAPGVSLGQASELVRAAAAQIGLPATVRAEFGGNAQVFAQSLRDEPLLILTALIAIYIVLGVLYESTLHPLTILSTLPSAGLGALLALILSGTELSLISVIGIIMLLGIVKKNGIMMVDFAIAERRRRPGLDAAQAILEACRQRFRPITMTTLTALLGALPLALAFGEGASLRRPLGIAIVGGLLVSQGLTLFTTPVVYLALDSLARRRGADKVAPGPSSPRHSETSP